MAKCTLLRFKNHKISTFLLKTAITAFIKLYNN